MAAIGMGQDTLYYRGELDEMAVYVFEKMIEL